MTAHHCHAAGCAEPCAPRLFACPDHWRALPAPFKAAIRREYRAGQERTKTPSLSYLAVQRFAVATLAFRPLDERAARMAAPYLIEAEIWRDEAIAGGAPDPFAGLPGARPHQPLDGNKAWAMVRALRLEAAEQVRAEGIAASVIKVALEVVEVGTLPRHKCSLICDRLLADAGLLERWRVDFAVDPDTRGCSATVTRRRPVAP